MGIAVANLQAHLTGRIVESDDQRKLLSDSDGRIDGRRHWPATLLQIHPDVDDVVLRVGEFGFDGLQHVDGQGPDADRLGNAIGPAAAELLGRVPNLLNDGVVLNDDDVGGDLSTGVGFVDRAAALHRHHKAEACHIAVGFDVPGVLVC